MKVSRKNNGFEQAQGAALQKNLTDNKKIALRIQYVNIPESGDHTTAKQTPLFVAKRLKNYFSNQKKLTSFR
jgi:hypothetical protein